MVAADGGSDKKRKGKKTREGRDGQRQSRKLKYM